MTPSGMSVMTDPTARPDAIRETLAVGAGFRRSAPEMLGGTKNRIFSMDVPSMRSARLTRNEEVRGSPLNHRDVLPNNRAGHPGHPRPPVIRIASSSGVHTAKIGRA